MGRSSKKGVFVDTLEKKRVKWLLNSWEEKLGKGPNRSERGRKR